MRPLPARYVPIGGSMDGGMGSVICCNDSHLDRQVAIKFIQDRANMRRMLDEFAALLKMRSKHVVQVFDILRYPDDEIGIVQEFIAGNDLIHDTSAQSGADAYVRTLWQIATGIADIHSVDVIHRDIKPNNMKLDAESIVKIFDFGLARSVGVDARTRGFVGTTGFAAPELFGAAVQFTKAIDVYAFGATALYLIEKRMPDELVAWPPRPNGLTYFSATPFDLPHRLATMLDACLHPDPNHRPQMSEVAAELKTCLCYDRHQALVVFGKDPSYLNAARRQVRLSLPNVGMLEISYDSFAFRISDFSGEVEINNRVPVRDEELPGSCVASLGLPPRYASQRAFITFDVSNPEIVL